MWYGCFVFGQKSLVRVMSTIIFSVIVLVFSTLNAYAGLAGDLTGDNKVDSQDLAVLASYWGVTNCADINNCNGADFEPNNGSVDIYDVAYLCDRWLDRTSSLIQRSEVLYSVAAEDGRVWDLSNGGVGVGNNSIDSDIWALRLGDYADQAMHVGYRTILSFDAASILPQDCNIISAQLEMVCGSKFGVSPFNWGGNCVVDINYPSLGASANLENSDYEAPVAANSVAQFLTEPAIDQAMLSTQFNSAGVAAVNPNGKTQIRVYFENSTNSDPNSDQIGFYSGEQADPNKRPKLRITYETTSTPTTEFYSIGAQDGRLWAEANSTTSQWEGMGVDESDSGIYALRLGDYLGTYAYRSIVAFDTSYLPDGCTILSARLELTRSYLDNTDPFIWGGDCVIDVNAPYFGADETLVESDWQASAGASNVAQFLADPGDELPMVSTDFNAEGLSAINKTGVTQMKVYFTTPVNGSTTDCLYFYSGDYSQQDKKPKLVITYQINN